MHDAKWRIKAAIRRATEASADIQREFKRTGSTDWGCVGSLNEMAKNIEEAHGVKS
jgi:hypothetical protein